MDRKSQQVLEFPAVRARLADQTNFPPSRRLAEALEPSDDPVIVGRGLQETDEARAFASEHPGAGIGGAHDIHDAVERAARGGRLETGQLLQIRDTLEAAAGLADALAEERRPLLRELGRALQPLPGLRATLERSIDPSGELLDGASPALGSLRRAVRVAYDRLRTRLDELVHGGELAGALQEPIITLRNGRYVVPVRNDARGKVRGIVHDQSGSGQTLFVEPLVAVELGNAWREAQLAEQAEVERILDHLSGLVGTQANALRATLEALARFDFWSAKARLAATMDATRAATTSESLVELLGARHPGLQGRVVPIDIRLGGEFTALVITGPNTGGKSVTLRTLGLLSLMHQAGLHVPAQPGSRLPVFRDIFADIGDEQSVAQSLSTFSGHMDSIVRIVEAAGSGTLVLLDELGAGTDPTEGSALAQALLDHFVRSGALVAATTHYAELKAYAHNTPAAMNASVDFDLQTLSPTYHLTIGLPGTSQAFAIAERLGLPATIVADARSRVTRAQAEFEETLAAIRRQRAETAEALERARLAEVRARDAQRAAEQERARVRRAEAERSAQVREEAERLVADLQTDLRAARRALERETLTEGRLDALADALAERLARIPAPERAAAAEPLPVRWQVGMEAQHVRGGWTGHIAALDEERGRATLETGHLRVDADLADLARPGTVRVETGALAGSTPRSGRRGALGEEPAARRRTASGSRSEGIAPPAAGRRLVPTSLDVRGARVEEALELLDRYLDDASLASVEQVTVVHGHGSGALRDAVRAMLSGHPLVQSWRPGQRAEGGDGATIVTL
ncbi:MAG: endonuclease MutS2 [Candidatus Limnocylindrales bacterium]